jgi:hypothetical protein
MDLSRNWASDGLAESRAGQLLETVYWRKRRGAGFLLTGPVACCQVAAVNSHSATDLGQKPWLGCSSPTKLRCFGETHNRFVSSGTRFPVMPNEQVLKHGVDDLVFLAVQFSVFKK